MSLPSLYLGTQTVPVYEDGLIDAYSVEHEEDFELLLDRGKG